MPSAGAGEEEGGGAKDELLSLEKANRAFSTSIARWAEKGELLTLEGEKGACGNNDGCRASDDAGVGNGHSRLYAMRPSRSHVE